MRTVRFAVFLLALASATAPLAAVPLAALPLLDSAAADGRVAEKARPGLELAFAGRFETGIFDESAAEIPAFDRASQRLFVTNAAENTLDVYDLSERWNPTRVQQIDLSPFGAGPNSVAAFDGVIAVAVEADPVTDPGAVVFFDADGTALGTVEVGALPDMLTFTPDGTTIVVANEGEPDDGVDPVGSVSILDMTGGAAAATVTTAGFEAFDGREAELRNRGVRLFPGVAVSADVEPEYVAVSPDSSQAFVTLQEANAFAVVDLDAKTVVDILPLGTKNHAQGPYHLLNLPIEDLPALGTTATVNPADAGETTPGQEILLGGLSGLWFDGYDVHTNTYHFLTVPDRGPNGDPTDVDGDDANERPFALPDYQARVVSLAVDAATATVTLGDELPLFRADGTTPITGLPNIPGVDEEPVDLFGNLLPYDAYGADMEGIVRSPDGDLWMVDEYRPAIYHFSDEGVLIERLVPEGTGALGGMPAGTYGTESLPAEYSDRRRNRGFEAVALDPAEGVLYAFIQTPLSNPDRAASDGSDVIRILGVSAATGLPIAEYVYLLEGADHRESKVDKIGDATWAGDGRMFVIERDSSVEPTAKKFVFEIDLRHATNLLADDAPTLLDGQTLEQHTADELAEAGIRPVHKRKAANLPSIGYLAGDKPEGLALVPGNILVVLNDNDFGLLGESIPGDGTVPIDPDPTPVVLGALLPAPGNTLDASNRDGGIHFRNWPVEGLYMPDAVESFRRGGRTYYITANEGDARDEDDRVGEFTLDPTVFPSTTLQEDEHLGRLKVSNIDGDLDDDGDYDRLYSYGGRSVTIWDDQGNLVWDSSDELARLTAAIVPNEFNSTNDENDSFDNRSDDKGIEPEGVEIGFFWGRWYAFIGLERVGGVVVYDLTNPHRPEFVHYLNTRDFAGDAEAGTAGDLGPEGLLYIPRGNSKSQWPALVVTHEVSGTVSVYRVLYKP